MSVIAVAKNRSGMTAQRFFESYQWQRLFEAFSITGEPGWNLIVPNPRTVTEPPLYKVHFRPDKPAAQ